MRKVLYLMGIMDDGDVEWLRQNGSAKFMSSGTVLIREGAAVDDVFSSSRMASSRCWLKRWATRKWPLC